MRALFLEKFGAGLEVRQVPIPQPGDGQLLVKMEASPINPSDLLFLQGFYQTTKGCPCVPGFEGAGSVVLSGYHSSLGYC